MSFRIYCWIGLALYVVLSAADLLLTRVLLQMNDAAFESNPAAAVCLEHHGWNGLALYKACGVLMFVTVSFLLLRRRPAIGAAVVTFGCTMLLAVTTYTHGLILDSQRELAERQNDAAWLYRSAKAAPNADAERCWFAGR